MSSQPSGLADSPISPLSPPSSPSFAENMQQSTVYDIIHASDNPAEFYNGEHAPQTSGCPHLMKYKQQRQRRQDFEDGCDLFDNYQSVVRYSLAWYQSRRPTTDQGKKKLTLRTMYQLLLPQCLTCSDPLSRLHVCLHCVYMGCWRKGHMRDHMKQRNHTFAMDFAHRTLYCGECDDYVYDTELNDRIVRQELVRSGKSRRKRARMWEPSDQEMVSIVRQSSLASCQGIRGLCNMGNTCFMNVILQSFVHNPLLKAYFLSDQHNPMLCENKFCLCCEMDNLFTQLYSGKKEPYGPCSFLQSMWMNLKDMAGYAQQDAHEFFISALNHIHAGCKGQSMVDCNCIVHKTFSGLLQSSVTCLRCGNVTTTCDPMLDISLGLRAEKRKKLAAQPAKGGGKGEEKQTESAPPIGRRLKQGNTLTDCLDRYTCPEKLGPNDYSCSKCGNTFQEATKQLSVKRLPPVLSFQLKRFEHGGSASKIESKIKFPVDLDMSPYTTKGRTNKQSEENIYTLFAVINHQGRMDTGHYTMFAKHRGEWFKFDDHSVTMAYQKDVLDSKAYMCLYVQKSLEYE
ncbi:hypothetical protein DFQ30_000611 [Apophysomyces sp. BC1015]|nr:hypothetical protein DFQ30_000611 [Apophysomyces sp. BC1015]KAG0183045.1 hypothetical protein DFQ29_000466 [Apophysomyces sp. BC1021]